MAALPHTIEIPALLSEKTIRSVTFEEQGLTIQKLSGIGRKTFLPGMEIAAFRFGITDIRGFKYRVGREYFVEIRGFNCQVSRIRLTSFYGIKKKTYYKVWADLLQHLWDNYMDSQLSYYTELRHLRQPFRLAGVWFEEDGICWDNGTKLPWDKIAVKSYQNYFMVHHSDDPRLYKCCVFSIDWNAVVLQSLLNDVIRESKLLRRPIRKDS